MMRCDLCFVVLACKIWTMDKHFIESTKSFMSFVEDSPSCFHVVSNLAKMLEDKGFVRLWENKAFKLEKGKRYFVCRNNSALISFSIPKGESSGYSIVAAHTDTPCFKIKANPEISSLGYTTLNVEGYGGMIMAPWFDRPLSVAGRAFVKKDGEVKECLVNIDRDLCMITNPAIHMNRKVNEGVAYKIQKDLLPILGLGENKKALVEVVAKRLGVKYEEVLDYDLYLYPRTEGRIWGLNRELFSSPRIDDLMCSFSAVKALSEAKNENTVGVVALFDNEEVGSGSKQGAMSDFLEVVLDRIQNALGMDKEEVYMHQAGSFMLSADNGHAVHPNYPEFSDPTNHCVPNGGVVIKYAANQKYTTDGGSAAFLKNLLEKNSIPYQMFFNNSNMPGGSTLGNLSNYHFSLNTVDIGAAQLAMHSPYETAGVKDCYYLQEAMKAFFER